MFKSALQEAKEAWERLRETGGQVYKKARRAAAPVVSKAQKFVKKYPTPASYVAPKAKVGARNIRRWGKVAATPKLRTRYAKTVAGPAIRGAKRRVAKTPSGQLLRAFKRGPREGLKVAGRQGYLGPIPQLARGITQRYPKTALPISHFAAGLGGPVPAEQLALGKKLPERERYQKYRTAGGLTAGTTLGGPRLALASLGFGAGIGGITQAVRNVLAGLPARRGALKAAGRGALYGGETSPTYAFTGALIEKFAQTVPGLKSITEKGIERTLPRAKQTIGEWLKNVGKTGIKRLIRATIAETPMEGITYGIKEKKKKEKLINSIAEETKRNFYFNIGFAGLNTAWDARTITPIVKRSFEDALASYKALPAEAKQRGAVKLPGEEKLKAKLPEFKIPKELEPLTKEARKYKSAEEFMRYFWKSDWIGKFQKSGFPGASAAPGRGLGAAAESFYNQATKAKPKAPEVKKAEAKTKVAREVIGEAEKELPGKPFKQLRVDRPTKEYVEENFEKFREVFKKAGLDETLSADQMKKRVAEIKAYQGIKAPTTTLNQAARLYKTEQKLASLSEEITRKAGKAGQDVWTEFLDTLKVVGSRERSLGQQLNFVKQSAEPMKGEGVILNKLIKRIVDSGADTEKVIKAAKKVDFSNSSEAVKFYRQFVKPTRAERINEFRYINMLSSPSTHQINIGTNYVMGGMIAPAERIATGTIDALYSHITGKPRTRYVREVGPYTKGFYNSIPKAFDRARAVFSGKAPMTRLELRYIPTGAWGPLAKIPRALEAADIFARTMVKTGEDAAIRYRAKRLGKEISEKAVKAEAEELGLYRTFRRGRADQGVVLDQMDKVAKWVMSGRARNVPLLKWFVPFVQTSNQMAKQGLEYTAGVATTPGLKTRGRVMEQLGKQTVGAMVMTVAAYLAAEDRLTWDAPTGEKAKTRYYQTRKPYSFKIGGRWRSYMSLGPMAYPFMTVAALKDSFGKKKRTADHIANMAKFLTGGVRMFGDWSYMRGLGDLVDALRGDKFKKERAITNLFSQLIPLRAFQGWLARNIDDVYRNPDSVIDSFKTQIPFLSKQVEPYYDLFGQEAKRPELYYRMTAGFPLTPKSLRIEPELAQQVGLEEDVLAAENKLEKGNPITFLPDDLETVVKAEYAHRVIKRETKKNERAKYSELVEKGYITQKVAKKMLVIKRGEDKGLSSLDRELFLYKGRYLALKTHQRLQRLTEKNQRKKYNLLQRMGILTPRIEKLMLEIKRKEVETEEELPILKKKKEY